MSHPALCLGAVYFPSSFPSSLHLHFPFLLRSIPSVHTFHVCSEFHQGDPDVTCGVSQLRVRLKMMEGRWSRSLPQTVPLAQMGSEDCSAFLSLNHQTLFISGPWPRINETSAAHKSRWLGCRERKTYVLCFSVFI